MNNLIAAGFCGFGVCFIVLLWLLAILKGHSRLWFYPLAISVLLLLAALNLWGGLR